MNEKEREREIGGEKKQFNSNISFQDLDLDLGLHMLSIEYEYNTKLSTKIQSNKAHFNDPKCQWPWSKVKITGKGQIVSKMD